MLTLLTLFIGGCSQKVSDYVEYSTSSSEAAKQMEVGIRYQDNVAQHLARESFQKAVDLDPEFAMAYYSLAQMHRDAVKRNALVEKGKQYVSKANDAEKALIEDMNRDMWWGGDGDIEWVKEVEEYTNMFPKETRYINKLGNMANFDGEEEKAEAYYKQSIAIKENSDALNSLGY